ncbi:MAG: hypothetical protein JWN08_843 [Frankiales bacterium]|nr:hypothetical protein [Frankiales bacterium]
MTNRFRVPLDELEDDAHVAASEQVTEQPAPRLPETGVWSPVPAFGDGMTGDDD